MPQRIPGVTVASFLRRAYMAVKRREVSAVEFFRVLQQKMRHLRMPMSMAGAT